MRSLRGVAVSRPDFRPVEVRAREGRSGVQPLEPADWKLLFDAVTARLRRAAAAPAGLVSNLPLAETAACLARTVLECTADLERLQAMLDPPRGSRGPRRNCACRFHRPGLASAGPAAAGTAHGAALPARQ